MSTLSNIWNSYWLLFIIWHLFIYINRLYKTKKGEIMEYLPYILGFIIGLYIDAKYEVVKKLKTFFKTKPVV